MTINEMRRIGRAKNALLAFLQKRLVVPKIYFDATWNDEQVDVLAIDRDGVGDVNVVLLVPIDMPAGPEEAVNLLTEAISPLMDQLESLPAQYKYVVAVDVGISGRSHLPGLPHAINDRSFSPDGIGRVGFLAVSFSAGEEASVQTVCKPERFRAKIAKLADEYVQQHEADWEIRA